MRQRAGLGPAAVAGRGAAHAVVQRAGLRPRPAARPRRAGRARPRPWPSAAPRPSFGDVRLSATGPSRRRRSCGSPSWAAFERTTAAPALVVPAPPKSRAQRLDQRLGDEVVRRQVHRGDQVLDAAGSSGSPARPPPPGSTPARAARRTVTPRRLSARRERLCGEARRAGLEERPAAAREAAVEGQRAERADVGGGAVALRRRPAEAVEDRLVADHAARRPRSSPVCAIRRSRQQARPPWRRSSGRRRRAGRGSRERRRSASAAAAPSTSVESVPCGPKRSQRGRRRVELLDRGRDPRHRGVLGVERLPGAEVDHVARRSRRPPCVISVREDLAVCAGPAAWARRGGERAQQGAGEKRRSGTSGLSNPPRGGEVAASESDCLRARWATSSSSRPPHGAAGAGGRRPRSSSAAAASRAPCTRSARCGRWICCRSTGRSTSSTSTSGPAPARWWAR